MNVEWTIPAIGDLDQIEEYIARNNPENAIRFINQLLDLGDSLEDETVYRRGTPALWIDDENIRELYYHGYTIVYEICDTTIRIHEVYNQKRIHLRYGKRRYS